jgi:hypothetical protein
MLSKIYLPVIIQFKAGILKHPFGFIVLNAMYL